MSIRIGNSGRTGSVGSAGAKIAAGGSGAVFSVGGAEKASPSAAASAASGLAGLDALGLIALQGLDGPRERRRRASRRGHELLDHLERLRIATLGGRLEPGRLERIVSALRRREPSGDERLDAVLDEIDLRARVELAKLGRFID